MQDVMWHMYRKNLVLIPPCLTATSDCPKWNNSYTAAIQCCGDQVNTHNTRAVFNSADPDYIATIQQAYCYQFGKPCAKYSSTVPPLLAQVGRRDLEPELASNLSCLLTDHL